MDNFMKYYKLDDYEKGKFKSVPNLKQEMARLKAYARATLDKAKKPQ